MTGRTSRFFTLSSIVVLCCAINSACGQATINATSPVSPPTWALLERQLLDANSAACEVFYNRYFDERGYLMCVERWGGDDGPDDAIENLIYWPMLHALGGSDNVLTMYKHAWEGHLRQFTEAKTVEVPFARDGMYYKEFPVMFDWLHNSEGLTVFNLQGLSDPNNHKFQHRVRRYAGFYMNEDPQAANYDPKHKIIKSLFNGSRGPLLRKATGLDWAGDPIEVKGRFRLGHGEDSYEEMVFHFKDYNDIVGDHPSNLKATSLALNAYMLKHNPKYKAWLLEYVDAWLERMIQNDGIIPSNIGLNGKIGGNADGKWYGGVYGWGFSVEIPVTLKLAHRNTVHLGLAGFINAYLLTGDDKYLDGWRKQLDIINSNAKVVKGKKLYPHNYGDDGWYNFQAAPYSQGALDIYYHSMNPADRARVGNNGWLSYLDGKNSNFPESALRSDLNKVRSQVQAIRDDSSTPDTRLSDDSMFNNPANVQSLVELMMGGLVGGKNTLILHARLRYFDPVNRRAGVPDDVAALINKMDATHTHLSLVNTSQLDSREVVIQAGSYGEHEFVSVTTNGKQTKISDNTLCVKLAPGAGVKLVLNMRRYANQPVMAFPWDR